MANTKELREQRLNLETKVSELIEKAEAENRDFTAEENSSYQAMLADSVNLKTRIERAERQDQIAKELAAPVNQDPPAGGGRMIERNNVGGRPVNRGASFGQAVNGWFNGQIGRQTTEEQEAAAAACGVNLLANQLVIPLTNRFDDVRQTYRNVLTSTAGSGGAGTFVPDGFINKLEVAMLWYGPMLQVSEVMRTNSGADFAWPTANDTGNSGRQIGETKAVTTLDPTLQAKIWRAYKFTSDEILIAYETLEDAGVDLESIIPQMLGERLGRILNTKFTTGTGAGTCQGITVGATTGKTTASSTAITMDEVLDLQFSVDPAYRANGTFMAHDNIIVALRKLKDSYGQYLWQPSIQMGQPDMLAGRPLVTNNDMDSAITTTKKTLIYGDLSKYKIRQVNEVRVYRLTERFRENDEDAFLAFVRGDGRLLDAGTHPVKVMVQV